MRIARESSLAIKILVWAAVTSSLLIVCPCFASGQEISRFDVFGGYSYMRFDSKPLGFTDYSNLNGWNIEGAVNIGDSFSVVLDGSGHYGSKLSIYNYMAGPQYSYRMEKGRFFGRVLFGKAQNSVNISVPTRNGFESVGRAIAAGGGYERDVTPRFSWRVQADFLDTHTFGNSQKDIRGSAGIVVHLGHTGRKPRM